MDTLPHPSAELCARTAAWPEQVQERFDACRALFHQAARSADVGALDETLKWRQPSWRPTKPRTGSTLRLDWDAGTPDLLWLYVDCKTDLAARMRDIYPDLPRNDGRRQLAIRVDGALPEQALSHLAGMTFTYHQTRRAT